MIQARSASSRYTGVRVESVHRRRRIHHNSKVRPYDAKNHHSNIFQSDLSHKPEWSIPSRMMNTVAETNEDTFLSGVVSAQQRRARSEEETSPSSRVVKRSAMSTSTNKKTNDLTNDLTYNELKHANQLERYNSFWKYTLMVLYGLLSILFLTALILPSILVYLLTPKSSQTGLSELSSYSNHCAGISPHSLWQINSTTTITMVLNTSQCHFQETPLYFVSVAGMGSHYCLTGYGAIYLPTKESFQIYTRYTCSIVNSTVLLNLSQTRAYDVNWIGFYK